VSFALDNSVALVWCSADEQTPKIEPTVIASG
jgi:hypothetical protein